MALAKSYQATLSKKKVEKMHIDRSGNHCFLICSDSLFYANFAGNSLQQIWVEEPDLEPRPALHFTCVDIQFIVEDDENSFELVAGSAMGDLYYGQFEYDDGVLVSFEPKLRKVLDGSILEYQRVLDIKLVQKVITSETAHEK